MKSLKHYIEEKLIICHQQVDEKLVINKNYTSGHSCKPKTIEELRTIIGQRIKDQGYGTEHDPISFNDIDTSEITTFDSLFWNSKYDNGISELKYIDVSDWDVSNVNNFRNTFYDCTELVSVGDLSDWDMTNAENISGMFYFCKSLTNIGDLSNWNITNKLTNTSTMFCMCKSIKDIGNIGKWDMSNVKSTAQMFMACSNLKNVGDLSNWDFTNVLAMSNMFWSCSSLKSIGNISKWKEPKAYKSDSHLYWHEIFTGSAIDAIPDWYMFN